MKSRSDDEPTISADLAMEAGAWDARLRADDCTDEDRARFAAWRDGDPAHQLAFERLQTLVATLRHEHGRADIRALRDEALRVVRQRRRIWFATAAAIVLALVSSFVVWKHPHPQWLSGQVGAIFTRLSGVQTFSTRIGQRSTFALPDGSSIELNARSRVKVRFSGSRRDVEPIEGQALFNVARDAQRPFIVRAGNRHVRAVGTRFDVRLDATSVRVTLLEGKVRVEHRAPADGASVADEHDRIELTPGQQLVATTRPAAMPVADVVRDIDVAKVTGWREGRIYFDDLTLAEAVREMNRHSTVRISIESPELSTLRVNGMFNAGEQELFVSALQEYFPLTAQRRGAREIALVER